MQTQDSFPVSPWVRNGICTVACLSILGLIFAAYQGVQLPIPLVIVVGSFALWSTHYAFRR